jgi:hypothetical protein
MSDTNTLNDSFDVDAFLTQTVDQPLSTVFSPVPEGEYQAMIDDFDAKKAIEIRRWTDKSTGEPRTALQLSLPFIIQDATLAAQLERDRIAVFARTFLDLTPAQQIDFGRDKNIFLGQVRAAVNQNNPGPWSIANLKGAGPVMVTVRHRSDKEDPEKKYVEVRKVRPIR